MAKKLKSLMPSLKEKKRYVLFEIISSEDKIRAPNPMKEVLEQVKKTMGIFDSAEAGLKSIKYKDGKGLIRVTTPLTDKLKASLLFIREIGTQQVIVKTIKTYGTIKKSNEVI